MNSSASFSIRDLPGDDWETRFTKRIVRNIVRAKDGLGITTAELAQRCNQFLGEEAAIKTSTLNGLFAGKRKSLGVAELLMFSVALGTPILALIASPSGDEVEVRPGETMNAILAMRSMMGVESWVWGPSNPLQMWFGRDEPPSSHAGREAEVVVMHWSAEEKLFDAVGRTLDLIDEGRVSDVTLGAYAALTSSALSEYRAWVDEMHRLALEPPQLPGFLSWVPDLDPSEFSVEFARQVSMMRKEELAHVRFGSREVTQDGSATDPAQ